MKEDLRCFTLHMFFRVVGAEYYSGKEECISFDLRYCRGVGAFLDSDIYDQAVEDARKLFATQLNIPIENVTPVSYEEFKENTKDEAVSEGLSND